MNVAPKEMGQKKKAIYSEEFQAMLDRLEEEDYEDNRSVSGGHQVWMRKSRLCIEQVKALEKHFEEENKLQPERKNKIAEEVGLEPRQVAIWFQNRRARSKTKQLETEYGKLRASYDALKHDYGSLQQQKRALLSQLKDLKGRIEAKSVESSRNNVSRSVVAPSNNSRGASNNESSSMMNMSIPISISSSSSSSGRTFDPFPFAMTLDGVQPCKSYSHTQTQQVGRTEEVGIFTCFEEPCNIFSVDQAPSMHWYHGDQ